MKRKIKTAIIIIMMCCSMVGCSSVRSDGQENQNTEENVKEEDAASDEKASSNEGVACMNTYVNPKEFDSKSWNGTFYMDGEENGFPITVEQIVKYVDPKLDCYKTSTIDNLTTGEGSIDLIDVKLDDMVRPTKENGGYDSASSQIQFYADEEDVHLYGLSMWMDLTEEKRFGDVELGKLDFGELSASESDLVYISRIQLKESGKYLTEMNVDELVEAIGQPYAIFYETTLVYKYDDFCVLFGFDYDSEKDEYTCCNMCFISKNNDEYERVMACLTGEE